MVKTFAPIQELDRKQFEAELKRAAASTRYVVHFTPRSGSSWLTDLAIQTKRLSHPDECFNPKFMPEMTRALNTQNMEEYTAILERRRNFNGVYGFQITHHQLMKVFSNHANFSKWFPPQNWHSFFLIREDIVAQAVSLWKMVEASISHSPQISESDVVRLEKNLRYSSKGIKRWLKHILAAERGFEAIFSETGARPFRMSYERNHKLEPIQVLNAMCRHLEIEPISSPPEATNHRKIGTDQNVEFADRFRDENKSLLVKVNSIRAKTLDALDDY